MGRQFGPSKPSSRCSSDPAGALAAEYDTLLACVRCGLCLTSCPTYVLAAHEAEGPRGRIAMLRALAEGRLALTPDLVRHERSCLVCDACTAVCPAGVRMGPLQVAFRAAIARVAPRPLWQRALRRVLLRGLFAHPVALRLVVRLLWLYQRSGAQALARRSGLLRLLGLAEREALLPPVPRRFVVPRGETYAALSTQRSALVALFAGCVMATGLALRELGDGGLCCGSAGVYNVTNPAEARRLQQRKLDAALATDADVVATANPGCLLQLRAGLAARGSRVQVRHVVELLDAALGEDS